ncbi:MAG: ABC transporter permease subunit [Actinomycetia bacterium]|nr:ABC transporter permease subunit [Actinomycetes bacterium]
MNHSAILRGLFWIGWLIWAVLTPWLLLRLPESLPLVTWTHVEGVINVTWSLVFSGFVLFWAWPVAFRTARVRDVLFKAGRGIAAGPALLWAGMRRSPLFFVSWAVLVLAWQVASYVVPPGTLEHPLVPGWDYVIGDTLLGMSRYWTVRMLDFGFAIFNLEGLAPLPIAGGEATWPAVLLAFAYHSGATLTRLLSGMVVGMTLGLLTGLALPFWPAVRKTAWAPMNFLRMIPLLVAAPWLQIVLGSTLFGITVYVAFGVWTILVVATMNAVANVPDRYIESSRTLGASRLHTYYRVIVPGSIPELRTALLLAIGGSWSLVIVAEFLGFSEGLGYLADSAVQETNTARLLIVAIVVALYSLTTFFLLNEGFKKVISWMPQRTTSKTDIRKVAGAAGGA